MWLGRTPTGRALRTFLIVFAVGSFLPAWEVIHVSPICALGESTSLWRAASDCEPTTLSRYGDCLERNAVVSFALVALSSGAGLAVYWRNKPRPLSVEAADFQDAPGGAVPDGRAGPTA